MALIISYRIIYLLRNATPVATQGINEEPNIYVILARPSADQITPTVSPTSLFSKLPSQIKNETPFFQEIEVGVP